MARSILKKCESCGAYAISRGACPYCGGRLRTPHPPKFSPEDRYQRYRLAMKLALGAVKVRDETKERMLKDLYPPSPTAQTVTQP